MRLPLYMGTVDVSNKMQMIGFFICCDEHHLKVLLKRHGLAEYTRKFLYH